MLKIRSLTLSHVAGVRHAHLEIPETGVVVVHGPNEAGKSTLLRAIRLLLDDTPTSSRKREVKVLKDVSVDEPTTMSARMTVGEVDLEITKAFNKGSGRCELTVTAPRAESLTGRQASDRFSDILREEVDPALLDALTVEQGASLDQLAAAGLGPLERALSEDAGADIATTPAETGGTATLIDRIAAERARYFTPGGRPSKELKAAQDELQDASEEHEAAEAAYVRAQKLIADLEQFRAEKTAVSRQEPQAREAARDAAEAFAAGKESQRRLEEQRGVLTGARQGRELAQQRLQVRADRISEFDTAEKAAQTAARAVDEATEAAADEREREAELRELLAQARRRSRTLTAHARFITARSNHRDKTVTHRKLENQQVQATSISGEIDATQQKLALNTATGDALTAVHRAVAELQKAESVRAATATTVQVAGPSDARFTVDGDEYGVDDAQATVQVTGRRELGLGEFTVTVTPGRDAEKPGGTADVDDAVSRAENALADALANAGADTVDQVEQRAEQRRRLRDTLSEQRLGLSQATGGNTLEELGRRIAESARDVASAESAATSAQERVRIEDPEATVDLANQSGTVESLADPPESLESLESLASSALAEAEQAEAEADALREQLDDLARAGAVAILDSRTAEHGRESARVETIKESLDRARAETTDEDLRSQVRSAEGAEKEAERQLEALVEELEQATGGELTDLSTLQGLAEGAQSRVDRLRSRVEDIGHEISTANGALGQHSGVAERRESASASFRRAERTLATVTQRADAADTLYRAVETARDDARRRYEAPYRASVEKLARTLYGRAVSVEFDENLSISRRVLDTTALDAAQLSGGAREQLAILSRLAVADIVGGGEGVPVVIDDALGFSDAARIRRMNLVLSQLGASHQIIVLTCEPARFDSVPGARVASMSQLMSEPPE